MLIAAVILLCVVAAWAAVRIVSVRERERRAKLTKEERDEEDLETMGW